jgi:uncharacterized membrane protein YbhN (UPF0104 family)
MTGRRAALLALNVAIIAVFAVVVQRLWGWQRLFAPWREVPIGWLAAATLAQLLSYALRAVRIYIAEAQIPRHRYGACLRLILINNALNLLLPMRSGEASFPLLMNRWFGVNVTHATGTLIWLRLLDLHVLAAVGLICVAAGWIGGTALTVGVGIAAVLAVTAPTALFLLRGPLVTFCAGHGSRLAALAQRLLAGLPQRAGELARDLVLTWSAWMVKLAALGWLLASLAQLPLAAGVLGAIGGDLSTVLPIHTPGGFGTYEAGALAALAAAQSPSPALLAAVVNLHLFVLTAALIAGTLAWLLGPHTRPVAA